MTRIHNFFLYRARTKKILNERNFDSSQNSLSRRRNISQFFKENYQIWNESAEDEDQQQTEMPRFQKLLLFFLASLFISVMAYLLFYSNILHVQGDEITLASGVVAVQNSKLVTYESVNKEDAIKLPRELPEPPKANISTCKMIENSEKLDCLPRGKATKEVCESRGCCWQPANASFGVPYCFYPSEFPSFEYLNITQTDFGLIGFIKTSFRSAYPKDVEILKIVVKYETPERLHIKIIDPSKKRFEPPYPEIPIVDKAASDLKYKFLLDPTISGFKIIRKSDSTIIFDALEFRNMIFSEQFLQISGRIPSQYIYGIGEHQANFLLSTNWTTFTLFNHDEIPQFDENLYGSHPFYMVLENSSNAHGVFLLNSNAMDIVLQPGPVITFRSIGGIFDFFFFMGPTPSDVISQYTDLIGLPYLPPYWGLGFHLCRFGYKTLEQTRKIMERNIDAGIPLDTQWNDLDYMNNSNDFTYDRENFGKLPAFIEELHARGMHYIPLIDPGVSASEPMGSYLPFDEGVKLDIFVKNSTNQLFIGKVWNKKSTVWPDFTHPDAVDYWTKMFRYLHNQLKFDGAWIDMNEPSNFLSGSITGCPQSELENPPYVPRIDGGVLNYKTMCMSCKHYAGFHYDVHNLYGFAEAIMTNFALAEVRGKRPMVISRATFPGHGHFAGHWSGDVWSSWNDMRYTIPQMLSFSLFGIPLMGADICGFNGNSTAALCNRWMQLGAFYPFSRNHNTDDGIDQDPVAFGDLVIRSSRKALQARYSLLPYLYTLFWRAHTNGETVARPLLFEFASDIETYSIDTQFLWGSALMIVPVLEENAETVKGYFPKDLWYDYYERNSFSGDGKYINLSAPLDTIPLFVRGGYIIPQQSPMQTSTETRRNLVNLLAALDEFGQAFGQLYWDDGDSLNTYEEKQYSLTNFTIEGNLLRISNIYNQNLPPNLGNVTILGERKNVSHVFLNDKEIKSFNYDPLLKVLSIEDLNWSFKGITTILWQ